MKVRQLAGVALVGAATAVQYPNDTCVCELNRGRRWLALTHHAELYQDANEAVRSDTLMENSSLNYCPARYVCLHVCCFRQALAG